MAVALVTGASSGIGQALARVIAADGYDVVLVARRASRRAALAAELQDTTGRQAEVLPADLLDPDGVSRIEDRLRSAHDPVEELVNNAGVALYGSFVSGRPRALADQFGLHVLVPLRLMHAVLPAMIERRSGGILNVASTVGLQATPGLAAYAASKAALISLSEAVHEETRRHGVRVTCAVPGYTRTELQDAAGVDASGLPGLAWMTADAVARAAWRQHRRGRAVHIPGLVNRASAAALRLAPRGVNRRASALLVSGVRQKVDGPQQS